MKTSKRKLPKFIDINTFDFTPYGRELTREEAYLVNGGQVMSQADQYAMAQAHAKGDQATMDAIVAKKSFSEYVVLTNSCGIAASNNNCWREKI